MSSVLLAGVTHGTRTTDLPSLLDAATEPTTLEATASGATVLSVELSDGTWVVRGSEQLLTAIAGVLSSAGCPATGPDPDRPA